jgi:hypothetical protein
MEHGRRSDDVTTVNTTQITRGTVDKAFKVLIEKGWELSEDDYNEHLQEFVAWAGCDNVNYVWENVSEDFHEFMLK